MEDDPADDGAFPGPAPGESRDSSPTATVNADPEGGHRQTGTGRPMSMEGPFEPAPDHRDGETQVQNRAEAIADLEDNTCVDCSRSTPRYHVRCDECQSSHNDRKQVAVPHHSVLVLVRAKSQSTARMFAEIAIGKRTTRTGVDKPGQGELLSKADAQEVLQRRYWSGVETVDAAKVDSPEGSALINITSSKIGWDEDLDWAGQWTATHEPGRDLPAYIIDVDGNPITSRKRFKELTSTGRDEDTTPPVWAVPAVAYTEVADVRDSEPTAELTCRHCGEPETHYLDGHERAAPLEEEPPQIWVCTRCGYARRGE